MAEIEKLAGIAAEANYVEAVHALPGGLFLPTVQGLMADYWAQADDDSGLTAFLEARWPEAQRAWAADVATVTGTAAPRMPRIEVEAPPASAILEAAKALRAEEREEKSISARDMFVLFSAAMRRRGPFAQRFEAELNAYYRSVDKPTAEGQAAHLEPSRR